MSLRVVHLDTKHNADLYKLLVKNKDAGGLQLIQKRDIYLNPPRGAAIACIEHDVIKQVLLCEFKNNVCFTDGIFGEFGSHTVEVLDILCATCSSSDPIVADHSMIIQGLHIDDFKLAWSKSRLGLMATKSIWVKAPSVKVQIFQSKIAYEDFI